MSKKPLCTARVSDFASNGVYKVFALHGAGCGSPAEKQSRTFALMPGIRGKNPGKR